MGSVSVVGIPLFPFCPIEIWANSPPAESSPLYLCFPLGKGILPGFPANIGPLQSDIPVMSSGQIDPGFPGFLFPRKIPGEDMAFRSDCFESFFYPSLCSMSPENAAAPRQGTAFKGREVVDKKSQ